MIKKRHSSVGSHLADPAPAAHETQPLLPPPEPPLIYSLNFKSVQQQIDNKLELQQPARIDLFNSAQLAEVSPKPVEMPTVAVATTMEQLEAQRRQNSQRQLIVRKRPRASR